MKSKLIIKSIALVALVLMVNACTEDFADLNTSKNLVTEDVVNH